MSGTGTTSKVFIPPLLPPSASSGSVAESGSSFNLGDDQKRWVVTGICLNKILLPTLRDFVEQEMIKHYANLKNNHNIDKQSHSKHLPKDGKCNSLNYGSINNNEANHKKKTPKYDYDVKSEVDMAKLYLQPFMAKFTGFDDTCDLSAVLGILSSASVFSPVVQGLSSDVRKDVRNEWGHCNFRYWNGTRFTTSFKLMDSLVRALSLAEEKKVTDELQDWETKGLQLCMGNIVDANLVKFIEVEVSQLHETVKLLSQKDEALRVSNGLKSIQESIEEYNKSIESLKESQDVLSQRVDKLSDETSTFSKDVGTLKVDQEHLTSEVGNIKKGQDTLKKRVEEALESAIESRSNLRIIFTFQAPNRIPCFHGRVAELEILAKALENKTAPCSVTAVYGLGGTGKTSLAIEHIWRNKDVYSGGVFWISGESNRLFDLSIREMARQIGTFDDDFKETLSKTIDWLQQRKELFCLVIDNLDELELSTEMLKLIGGQWKRQATGHILITTRRDKNLLEEEISDLSEENCIELRNLTEDESVEFFKMRTGRTGTREDSVIRELVVELGTLPLALDQAAAFIKNRKEISFSQYLDKYREQKLDTLKRSKAHYPSQDTSKDRIAVNTTWQLNFEYVSRLSEEYGIGQATALVMEVCAFFSPDDIPKEIINQGLPPVKNEDFISCLSTSFGVTDIVSVLTKFSLFQTYTDKSFRVHRLVQEVIRSRISQEHLKHVLLSACRMLCSAFAKTRSPVEVCKRFEGDSVFNQKNPPSLHLWGKLGAHASVLQKHLIDNSKKDKLFQQEILYTEESALILNEASLYLSVCRQNVEAMELQDSKLKVMTQLEEISKEKVDCLKHFDIPLKNVQYKLISHCMARQESISTDNAVSEISKTINKDAAQKGNQLREKGNEAVRSKKYDDAINHYTQAIELVKDDPRLFNNRALSFLKEGKPEAALHDCESCLNLEERNGKALMRKAWALFELSKSQGEKLKGKMRAAAALAAYVHPETTNETIFKEMFPNPSFKVIRNSTQLAGSLLYGTNGKTLLLDEGYYELNGAMFDQDVQLVALSKGVILKFNSLGIFGCGLYAEGIVFAKESGGIICRHKGHLHLLKCKISGGFSCCDNYPECNGGSGCIAAKLAGRKPCDRTGQYGEDETSGITGNPSIQIIRESTGYIENCDIAECGGEGILCEGAGSSLTVTSCRVHNNRQAGLEAREGGRLVAIDNDIYANGYHGISIGPSSGECGITKNRIYENNKEGIFVQETKDKVQVVDDNRIYHNLAFGISLKSCQVKLNNNDIFENGFYGIGAADATKATIESNDIYNNKCGGIHAGIDMDGDVTIMSNTVRDNSGPWLKIIQCASDKSNSTKRSSKKGKKSQKGNPKLDSKPKVVCDRNTLKDNDRMFHPEEMKDSIKPECGFCHQTSDLFRCSRCKIASYCNKTCQEGHWEKHKALCSALTEQYCVTVEVKSSNSAALKTGGGGAKPKTKKRFVVKVQTRHLNCHPLQNLSICNQKSVDGVTQSRELFHVVMECGILDETSQFTGKKAFFYATFAAGGQKLNIFLGKLAPKQNW